MRPAVLDIGSNSAQLQVVDVSAGAPPLPAHAVKEPPLLAEELLPDGTLSDEGVERVTAGVSRDEVIDRIQAGAGIRPRFLSGEQEARLTYFAARRWYGVVADVRECARGRCARESCCGTWNSSPRRRRCRCSR